MGHKDLGEMCVPYMSARTDAVHQLSRPGLGLVHTWAKLSMSKMPLRWPWRIDQDVD